MGADVVVSCFIYAQGNSHVCSAWTNHGSGPNSGELQVTLWPLENARPHHQPADVYFPYQAPHPSEISVPLLSGRRPDRR